MSYYGLTFNAAVDRQAEHVRIVRADPEEAAPRRAVEVLRSGGLVVFPTEAGYLVGCDALNPRAIRRLCEVTGATRETLLQFAATPEQADRLVGAVHPLRHPVALALMREAGAPLAAAACRPGAPLVPSAQHAVFVLGDGADLVLDAGTITLQRVEGRR